MKTIDFIETIIDSLRETASISSITNIGNIYTINTSDTKNLKNNDNIYISGNIYFISNLIINTSFKITSTTAVVGATWKAASPYYFYGTPQKLNEEFAGKQQKNRIQQGYFVFLFEILKETINNDKLSNTLRTSSLELYFLKFSNLKDWTTYQHYLNVIDYTSTLSEAFITKLNNNKHVMKFDDYTAINYANWGKFMKDKGFKELILNQLFSGTGIFFDLPLNKSLEEVCVY